MAHSPDLRIRVVRAVNEKGMSVAKAADDFAVSKSSVRRWCRKKAEKDSVLPEKMGRPHGSVLDKLRRPILRLIRKHGGLMTLEEIRAWLADKHSIEVCVTTISTFLSKCGYARKRATLVASEQNRRGVKRQRAYWKVLQRYGLGHGIERLTFLDETWLTTNMAPVWGWAKHGEPLAVMVPNGHRKTSTLIAALQHDGVRAARVLDGPITAKKFEEWISTDLSRFLKPGDIVIMDNLSSHKTQAVLATFEELGVKAWFLPPYSPDFNPIEQVFSKLKRLLRKMMARSWDALLEAVDSVIEQFTAQECENYIRNSGYYCDMSLNTA